VEHFKPTAIIRASEKNLILDTTRLIKHVKPSEGFSLDTLSFQEKKSGVGVPNSPFNVLHNYSCHSTSLCV